jgi:hypothetical protein
MFYIKEKDMNKYILTMLSGMLLTASAMVMAITQFNYDPQVRNTNYVNFMRQYPNPEYQIITPNNLINMDWLRGAAAAVFYDGYTYDNDIAQVLWRHMTNVVNFVADRAPNKEEMKRRLWQALVRSIEELRRQGMQQQQVQPRFSGQTAYAPATSAGSLSATPYAAPMSAATTPTRALPAVPTAAMGSLDIDGILNGSLGAEYASKLREILNYNDEKSKKAGLIALASAITTNINDINEEDTPRATKVTDLKRRIDVFYNKMLQRRLRD